MFKRFEAYESEPLDALRTGLHHHGLYCINCDALITDKESKITRQGMHRHTCTNPAHQTFTLGCFQTAPGCINVGIPTRDHSWFSGYGWCIALCARCRKHLGWQFSGAGDQFHGLILSELVEK